MKQIIIAALLAMFAPSLLRAQGLSIDVRFGVSPGANPYSSPMIIGRSNPHDEFLFRLLHVDPQIYMGVKAHQLLNGPFFLEGGLTYTKRNSTYEINYRMTPEGGPKQVNMKSSENFIMVPVDIGVSLGAFDITSGLRVSQTISSNTELSHLNGYQDDSKAMRMGWQMGARYGYHRIMAGVEFQGTMHRVCDGISVKGDSLEIMNVPGRFVFSIGYRI